VKAVYLTIGELSRETGIKVVTIRYYERMGAIPEPGRSSGGHRLYVSEDIRRLEFLKKGRELGFSLKDLAGMLLMLDQNQIDCLASRSVASEILDGVRRRIEHLKCTEKLLEQAVKSCGGNTSNSCAVINAISGR
tara:strand:- start:29845 stop:30249 length:405 start_codon:yes stop_codon:yes gene_type:complete